MKYSSLLIAAAFLLTACHPQRDAAFDAVSGQVVRVQSVVHPGSDSVAKAVAVRGGFPNATETGSMTKSDGSEFSLGYDNKGKPILAIVVGADGKTDTLTDPDVLAVYEKKARGATGQKGESVENAPASSGALAAGAGGDSRAVPKGCPIHLGETKQAVEKRLGPPTSTSSYSNNTSIVIYAPFDAQATAESEGAGRALGMLGGFGALGRQEVGKRLHHSVVYGVTYSGGVVAAIQVDN